MGFTRNQRGMTLIECVVAVAIAGTIALALSQLTGGVFTALKSLNERIEIEEMRALLRLTVHCPTSMARRPSGCAVDDLVSLYDKTGRVKVAAPFTTIGKRRVRAACSADPKVFRVQTWHQNDGRWNDVFAIPFSCR